ncbi:MAG: haloacid dehalogenase-like hydrolase [Mesorhizobium sp.]|nr:MAG: haloacid dehalogenase-like hydrolase [Mesorhizobium sp.]RWQ15905.1 MAG: haloacid dehalogenase-like hydrolase [Mesorhizobium sp.]
MSTPLPSWNEGAAKHAILDFVGRVTQEGSKDFVPVAARIATFDNDGTLWCEQPMQVQFFFALQRLAELAKQDPSLKERQPFKAILDRDMKAIAALGKEGAVAFGMATHAGMTADEFDTAARAWFAKARHPTLDRLFKDNVYQPQVELLDYLRANDFRTFIVSGGGIDLIRAFAEEKYGIARDQVIGSSVKSRFEMRNERAEIVKLAELDSFDDREVKPANIYLHIGRRPILAFGNSDGDLAMLRYARTGPGPSLALLLHHDDGEREFAYDREFRLSPLAEGLDKADEYGITVVSMRKDWAAIFGGKS